MICKHLWHLQQPRVTCHTLSHAGVAGRETCVQAFKPAKRLGVRPEAEGGLDTIHPYVKPRKPGAALHPCKEFSETSCCSNVGAQEIGDGFEHLMNIGGSGGVPVDDERCYLKAKAEHIALKDYFCLYCNPYQANTGANTSTSV